MSKATCPKCGFTPKLGRPREFDRIKAKKLKKRGYSLREISEMLEVTHGAVANAINEGKRK